jgi:hypothetical protein
MADHDSPEQQRYERIREVLQEAILRDYPNPDRHGCPGSEALTRLAARRRPIRDADWEHVTHCSPCYREFLEFRAETLEREQHKKQLQRRAAIAAAVLLIGGVLTYWAFQDHRNAVITRTPAATGHKLQISAVLNLESESETRGDSGKTNTPAREIQRLPRSAVDLSIYLPLGSEPGSYEIQLFKNRSDAIPLGTFSGVAQIENGLTVLRIAPDFSPFQAGTYSLAIRRNNASWHYYTVILGTGG